MKFWYELNIDDIDTYFGKKGEHSEGKDVKMEHIKMEKVSINFMNNVY